MGLGLASLLGILGCSDSGGEAPVDAMATDTGADAIEAECLPSDDMCPVGEYCEYTSGRLQCMAEGMFSPPLQTDPLTECADGICARGYACMVDARGGTRSLCYPVCTLAIDAPVMDPFLGCSNGRHTCVPAIGDGGERLPFGLCYYGAMAG